MLQDHVNLILDKKLLNTNILCLTIYFHLLTKLGIFELTYLFQIVVKSEIFNFN